MSSQKVTDEQVFNALRKCMDPEIPVNVVDLGLIYNVRVHPTNDVGIEMTMTTRGCPLHDTLVSDVKRSVGKITGIGKVVMSGPAISHSRPSDGFMALTVRG